MIVVHLIALGMMLALISTVFGGWVALTYFLVQMLVATFVMALKGELK